MVEDAYCAAEIFGDCLLLLDRYFLTVPALEKLVSLARAGMARMEIVTKAKKSYVAYEKLVPKSREGAARPKKEPPST